MFAVDNDDGGGGGGVCFNAFPVKIGCMFTTLKIYIKRLLRFSLFILIHTTSATIFTFIYRMV